MTDGVFKQPSLREAARRGGAAKQQAPPVPAAAGKRVEQVAAACGHAVELELFEDAKDKYRDQRRKNLRARPCPDCRKQAQAAKEAAEQKVAAERRRNAPARNPLASFQTKDRLPHGSRFDVAWDAEKGQWSGTLAVPSPSGGEGTVFTASASGVFPLLRQLDRLYRATLPEKPEAGQADDNRDVGGEG